MSNSRGGGGGGGAGGGGGGGGGEWEEEEEEGEIGVLSSIAHVIVLVHFSNFIVIVTCHSMCLQRLVTAAFQSFEWFHMYDLWECRHYPYILRLKTL